MYPIQILNAIQRAFYLQFLGEVAVEHEIILTIQLPVIVVVPSGDNCSCQYGEKLFGHEDDWSDEGCVDFEVYRVGLRLRPPDQLAVYHLDQLGSSTKDPP